jgi:zinc transport system permease protein
MSFFEAIFTLEFMRNACIASILASLIASVIGVIVIEKKLVMLTGGVSHTAFGGVGLGYLVGFEPILGGGIFAIIASLVIGALKKKNDKLTDVFIAVFWSVGMALGTVFISLSSGYAPDTSSYLFGNILTVTNVEIIALLVLAVIIVSLFFTFITYVQAYLFDDEFLKVKKVNVTLIEVIINVLIALAVVVLIKVTGIILVLALLAVPSATSMLVSKRLLPRVLISSAFGVAYCFLGMVLSYEIGLPTGATIIIVSSITYFIIKFIVSIINKRKIAK